MDRIGFFQLVYVTLFFAPSLTAITHTQTISGLGTVL